MLGEQRPLRRYFSSTYPSGKNPLLLQKTRGGAQLSLTHARRKSWQQTLKARDGVDLRQFPRPHLVQYTSGFSLSFNKFAVILV
jgi:hypothetical protein